jgi:poly-gamma-glutamate capsule biosynthesis protein CapA/YwtB (metallophosphatase superfamily)
MPLAQVRQHLDALSDAGAVVVSGSQAHFPQGFSFRDNGFVHYGLGNLFFDQMDYPVVGTRREFYDKHFFYNGRYINSQLLTGLLEDYAQPRPMTAEERAQFLSDMFAASGL